MIKSHINDSTFFLFCDFTSFLQAKVSHECHRMLCTSDAWRRVLLFHPICMRTLLTHAYFEEISRAWIMEHNQTYRYPTLPTREQSVGDKQKGWRLRDCCKEPQAACNVRKVFRQWEEVFITTCILLFTVSWRKILNNKINSTYVLSNKPFQRVRFKLQRTILLLLL